MSSEIFFWLAGLSIILYTPWEFYQANWLVNCRDKPWYIRMRNCSVGVILDTVYTLGLYYLFASFKDNQEWLLHAGVNEYALVFIISLLTAYVCEWVAWKINLWQYHKAAPRFPKYLGSIAISPVLQLPVLVSITFFITQLIIR
jgi:hypothetical protein